MCGAQADNVYVAQPVDESARPSVQACPLLLESVCTSYICVCSSNWAGSCASICEQLVAEMDD